LLSEATGLHVDKLKSILNSDVNEQNIDEQGRFTELMESLDKDKGVAFLKRVTGKDVKRMFVLSNVSNIIRRFILVPPDRDIIINAYQREDVILDAPKEQQPEPEQRPEAGNQVVGQGESNKLSDEEKRQNVRLNVMGDLRGIQGMPPSEEVVNAFFKIINLQSLPQYDGIAFDFYKVFDELFARREVNFVDKHVNLAILLVRFEVYLKKLYYLISGSEILPADDANVNLIQALKKFPCLWSLRWTTGKKYKTLSDYLERLRMRRNTEAGNGAHASMFLTEKELDNNIHEAVVLYMYVTGMCLGDLKDKYPEELG
jgi:type I restriction enzyme R subunit